MKQVVMLSTFKHDYRSELVAEQGIRWSNCFVCAETLFKDVLSAS